MYRGYIPTKNKKPLLKFKDAPLLTLEEVSKYDEYAGVLAKDTILIDIDNQKDSEKMMHLVEDLGLICRVVQTSRGKHFYFKNSDVNSCYTGVNLACGLKADIKVGVKNSYAVVKYKDEVRPIIYDKLEDEEYNVVPFYLKPVKCDIDFSSMSEGDGRNQTLFNYILKLQSCLFSQEQIIATIKLLNNYVLDEQLSENEINTILRPDAFSKPTFYSDKTFLFDKFSKYLKDSANIISLNDNLFIYKDGIYKNGDIYIEQEMIKNIELLTQAKRKEVLSYLRLIVEEKELADARYIAFNNGIYDIVDDVMLPFSPDFIITNKIPFDYVPDSYHKLTDDTLNKLSCEDKEIRALLEEVIGYCFYRRNELRKSFFSVGGKSTGKSTFIEMLHYMLGNDNVSTLSLDDIGDRFRTADLFGKLANLGDDIEESFSGKISVFKNLVSGSQITVERKGKDPFNIERMYTKFFFSANKMPYFKDKAAIDRLIILPFRATITPNDDDFDPYIKYKLLVPEMAQYLICIGLKGLRNVLKNKGFTKSVLVEQEMKDYEETNNPIIRYLKDKVIDDFVNNTTNDAYLSYCLWAEEEGLRSKLGKSEFTKQVNKTFNLYSSVSRIDGKCIRVFAEN